MIRPTAAPARPDPLSYARLRQQILRRDNWRCQSCGTMTNLEVHHREFRSHSGADTEENLITRARHATPECMTAKTMNEGPGARPIRGSLVQLITSFNARQRGRVSRRLRRNSNAYQNPHTNCDSPRQLGYRQKPRNGPRAENSRTARHVNTQRTGQRKQLRTWDPTRSIFKSTGSGMTQVIVTDRPRKLVPEKCPAFICSISAAETIDWPREMANFSFSKRHK